MARRLYELISNICKEESQWVFVTNDQLIDDVLKGGLAFEYVVDVMEGVVRKHIPVSHASNAMYTAEHVNNGPLLGGVFSASSSGTVNSARQACARMLRSPAPWAPPGSGMPSGEWQRLMLARLTPGAAEAAFAETVAANIGMLQRLGQIDGPLDVAIDMHLIPRYDMVHGPELTKSKHKAGTNWFERHITIQSVTPGLRLTLGVLPMPAGEDKAKFVRKLIQICWGLGVKIGVVMLDREFFATAVMRTLANMGITYLIPCRNTDTVIEELGDFAGAIGSCPVRHMMISDGTSSFEYIGKIVKRRNKTKYGGLREDEGAEGFNYEDPTLEPPELYIMFATNDPELDVEMYAMRWGIETGYRMIENARPKTRSTRPEIRAFCFMYGVMMFNAWMMFNIQHALQEHGDLGEWDGIPLTTQNTMTFCMLLRIMAEYQILKPPPQPPP